MSTEPKEESTQITTESQEIKDTGPTCKICEEPLKVWIEDLYGENEDDPRNVNKLATIGEDDTNDANDANDAKESKGKEKAVEVKADNEDEQRGGWVPDDVELRECHCHFHWLCLMGWHRHDPEHKVFNCPACGKYVATPESPQPNTTGPAAGSSSSTSAAATPTLQILADITTEGGHTSSFDLVPTLQNELAHQDFVQNITENLQSLFDSLISTKKSENDNDDEWDAIYQSYYGWLGADHLDHLHSSAAAAKGFEKEYLYTFGAGLGAGLEVQEWEGLEIPIDLRQEDALDCDLGDCYSTWTLLDWAVNKVKRFDIVKWLVENGANIDYTTCQNKKTWKPKPHPPKPAESDTAGTENQDIDEDPRFLLTAYADLSPKEHALARGLYKIAALLDGFTPSELEKFQDSPETPPDTDSDDEDPTPSQPKQTPSNTPSGGRSALPVYGPRPRFMGFGPMGLGREATPPSSIAGSPKNSPRFLTRKLGTERFSNPVGGTEEGK